MNALLKLVRLAAALPLALAACSSPVSSTGPLVPTQSLITSAPVRAADLRAGHGAGSYLYVENNNSTISAYAIEASGALEEMDGSPYDSDTTSPGSFSIAVDPKGPYLYATGTQSANVAIFAIGSGGALTLSSDATQAGSGAGFLLFTNRDKYLDVINGTNGGSIDVFDVTKSGAKLKSIKGSPFGVSCPGFCTSNPSALVENGGYLYSVDQYGWYVSSFSVAANGALTELDSYATGDGPNDEAMTSKGTYLYVTNGAQASVSAYSVASGALTQVTGSAFPAGNQPVSIVISPNDKYVYVANNGDATISGYSIGAGGVLKQLSGSPFADGSGTAPTALIVDAKGKHLFVANGNAQNVAVYAIAASGKLSQIKGSPFAERSGAAGPKGLAMYQ